VCVFVRCGMLSLICANCSGAIRVARSAVGKKQRCPVCNAIIRIPKRPPQDPKGCESDGLHERKRRGGSTRVPDSQAALSSSPVCDQSDSQDLDLRSLEARSLLETDILPAMQYRPVREQQAPPTTRRFRKHLRPGVDVGDASARSGGLTRRIKLALVLLAGLGGAVALLLLLNSL